jgi:hypothetical protein
LTQVELAPGEAWVRRTPCRRWSKLHRVTLRVTSPVRQRLATSRKRVLRGRTIPRKRKAAKRRQRVRRPCDGASKVRSLSRALGVFKPGGSTDAPRGGENATRLWIEAPALVGESRRKQRLPTATVVLMARRGGLTGVREHGIRTQGSPRNLGGHVVPAAPQSVGGTAEPRDNQSGAGRATWRHSGAYNLRSGGSDPSDPVEDEGGAESWNHWRERWRRHQAP